MRLSSDFFLDRRYEGNTILEKVQFIQFRMLKYMDYICRQYDLEYWLDGGTLLGAVRHQGFIPWDDDIDIVMPREDFIKFIKIAKKTLPTDMYLEISTERGHYGDYHVPCKIRDKYTKIVEMILNDDSEVGKGISMDIIPMDQYSNNKITFFSQMQIKKLFRKICIIRNNSFYIKNFLNTDVNKVKFLGSSFMFFIHIFFMRFYKISSSERIGYGFDVFWTRIFDKRLIYPLIEMDFCGDKFYIPANSDAVLRIFYGNHYMELPNIENRVTHIKSLIIDIRESMEICYL